MPFVSIRIVAVFVLLFGLAAGVTAQLPPGFVRFPVAEGLNPTSMTVAPDGTVYVTEKNGRIRIVRDDVLLPDPLLRLEVDSANERGLGHMVLHPDFEINGFFYVYYSVPGLRHNRVSRFTAAGDKTVPGSEKVILDLDPTGADIHNGGAMVFGFDGHLYIATGDGSQNWRGEDLGSTNAKVLRVTQDGAPVADNPWFSLGYLRCNLVYAYGLRNPFTMALHPHTGEIFLNDVGAFTWEEINRLERGAFYGWPKVEGWRQHQPLPDEYRDPVYALRHQNGYCAIVGGAFYAPETARFPVEYAGLYFFSDYCTGNMHILDPETGTDKGIFMQGGKQIIDIEIARDGALYYLERRGLGDGSQEDNTSTNRGILWKVEYTGSGTPFISEPPASLHVVAGEPAEFRVNASGAPVLRYAWYVNGQWQAGAEGPVFLFPVTDPGMDSSLIYVEVRNAKGYAFSSSAVLRVTNNQRPQPTITIPQIGDTYRAGDTLHFSGYAVDPEDGLLNEASLTWRVDFHHGTHVHPALSPLHGVASGSFGVPNLGEIATDVWFRISLTASDQAGLQRTLYTDVHPDQGVVKVRSAPSGLVVALDGSDIRTPYGLEGVQGVSRFLTVPRKQVAADSLYFFTEWSDGSKLLNREVRASAEPQMFTALFEGVRKGSGTGLTASFYNNVTAEGDPVAVALSPAIDYQFFLQPPRPDVQEDFFSIVWRGYLEPVRSGVHRLTAYGDDYLRVTIDQREVLADAEPGPGYHTASIYLEAGRLYPIEVYFADLEWTGNISLKWAHASFPEEVIPTAQLYPIDGLLRPDVMGVLGVWRPLGHVLEFITETYRTADLAFSITDVAGRNWSWISPVYPARNILTVNLSNLPAGLYYVTAQDARTGEKATYPFVKMD